MDINSYSYTAPGFGVDYSAPVAEYRDDDMRTEITTQRHVAGMVYNVWAGSYTGDFDVYETFYTLESARALYSYIVDNRNHISRRELRKAITAARHMDNR